MIQKGTELFNMWADAYRLFDRYSEPPAKGTEGENMFWRRFMDEAIDLCEVKYGNSKNKKAYMQLISGIVGCIEVIAKEK